MSDCCIINLASGKWYPRGQARLVQSLKDVGFTGGVHVYQNEKDVGAPLHSKAPYGFKPYTFMKAKELGYTKILWVDASAWAVADVTPVFDVIKDKGYIMEYAGHNVGRWCNDHCLKHFDLTREEAKKILMYGNGGFLGFDFDKYLSDEFLHRWKHACDCGAFNGSWDDHRHDMTCGSIIAHRLKMEFDFSKTFFTYGATPTKPETCFCCQGM